VMFARTAEKFGAPSYQPPSSILRLGKLFAAKMDGPAAYAAIQGPGKVVVVAG
jgi:hypothetical protein